ncbi:MAG TPA: hypothetical protein VGK73_08655 [Polyangiaceae bacterium]
MVAWPGQNKVGQVVRYIGRRHKVTPECILHSALPDPIEVDSESAAGALVRRLVLIERESPFHPADEATAKALDLPFVRVALVDGEFQEATEEKVAKTPKSSTKDGDK